MSSTKVFQFNKAIVRAPAKSVVHGLRAADRGNPTFAGIKTEHDAYVAALQAAGVDVTVLPPLEALPDSIFVEDPALVFSEGAIVLRPGALTRIDESAEIAPTVRHMFDTVIDLPAPGFADGGDILTTSGSVLIGMSARTDRQGAESLVASLAQLGRKSRVVETPDGVLHFKTDCSLLDEETILVTHRLAGSDFFAGFRQIVVPAGEEPAANALRVNDVVFVGSDYPRTIALLDQHGFDIVALKTTEIGKIDAGLSCMSLRWSS